MRKTRSLAFIAFIVLLASAESSNATNQVWNRIRFNGADRLIEDCPLIDVVRRNHGKWNQFDDVSTANRKSFTTEWEIRDQKLWLTKFEATIGGKPVPISDLLPGRKLPTAADWYNGELHIPIGEPINDARSHYKRIVILKIENGAVVRLDERRDALLESAIVREKRKFLDQPAGDLALACLKEDRPAAVEEKLPVGARGVIALPVPAPPPTRADDLLKDCPYRESVLKQFGDEDAYNLIQSATKVEAVRIGRLREDVDLSKATVADYTELSKVVAADDQVRWRLKRVLIDPHGPLCPCRPIGDVRIRFFNDALFVDVLIGFEKNKFGVYRDGKRIGYSSFGNERPELVRIMRRLFPNDDFVQKLHATDPTETKPPGK